MTKVSFAVPTWLGGGGLVTGNSMEEAVGNFLERFEPEDVRAFAQGYAAYAERTHGVKLSRPTQRVAMVRPQGATVTAQKAATQPAAPTVPSKAAKHASVPYLPPGAPARDVAWMNIVVAAGSTDPVVIDAFLQTPAGERLYAQYLAAIR